MSQIRISQLPVANSVAGNTVVPVVQSGATQQATVDTLRAEITGNLNITETTVNSNNDLTIVVNNDDSSYTWIFDTTGNLTIPNDILSNTTIEIDNRLSGNSADIRLFSADDITLQGRDRSAGSGTEGGDINIYAGDSAEDGDASGGDIQIFAGDGGAANVDFGGVGGFITIRSGRGGSAIGDGVSRAESGGALTIEAGDAGGNNGNIDRGADGGDVFIFAGESTGNLDAGGDIVLTTGPGGPNAPAGNVRITIPSSDLGGGGTWTFDGTGNLIVPSTGYINGADGAWVRIQSLEEGVVRSSMTLNPGDGLTRLESWDNENSQGFTSADWSSAEYVDGGPAGQIAFVDAPSILNLVNSIETSRLFLQVNGGSFMPYQGYGGSGNNITFDVLTAPATSPETVTSFTMTWSNRSRIEMDYDEGELNITARNLDITINGDQDVDIQSSDRIRIENSSTVNGITISTDTANTFRSWVFGVDGSLEFPNGANIAGGNLNAGTASASVALNAFSPDGNTVSIQAQGNSSSAVISIFSNAGPVTSNWTFTTAPLDPSESLLYIPNGGTISTPNATDGEGGKNIFIVAGASDPVTWNSNPGGELIIQGGYGSFGDGGGGPGGDVNINGGASSDSHAGNVTINSDLNTWTFDYNGNLSLPASGNIVGLTANNSGYLSWNGNSSGDGNGYTTLRLIPDNTRESADQYLIIDPTAPGHIHIRAGGTQDNSSADLILGGENTFVKIAAGANSDVFVRSNNNDWNFGTDGVLTLPGEGVIQSMDDTITLSSFDTLTGNANSVYLSSSGGVGFYDQAIGGNWLEIFRSGAEPEIRVPVGRGNLNIQTAQGENSYNWKFDDTGILSLPTIGGDEGGEINFGIPTANTTLTTRVVLDVFQDRIRFFDGSTKGAYIDLAQAGTGVSTLLNNRVSGLVNAGTFVTMDNLRATITTSSNRGLSLATVAGTITYDIGGTYGASVATGGASLNAQNLTTSATTSIFGWNFPAQGDTATYILNDTTNSRAYRITIMIGLSYNSNMISIERLV